MVDRVHILVHVVNMNKNKVILLDEVLNEVDRVRQSIGKLELSREKILENIRKGRVMGWGKRGVIKWGRLKVLV